MPFKKIKNFINLLAKIFILSKRDTVLGNSYLYFAEHISAATPINLEKSMPKISEDEQQPITLELAQKEIREADQSQTIISAASEFLKSFRSEDQNDLSKVVTLLETMYESVVRKFEPQLKYQEAFLVSEFGATVEERYPLLKPRIMSRHLSALYRPDHMFYQQANQIRSCAVISNENFSWLTGRNRTLEIALANSRFADQNGIPHYTEALEAEVKSKTTELDQHLSNLSEPSFSNEALIRNIAQILDEIGPRKTIETLTAHLDWQLLIKNQLSFPLDTEVADFGQKSNLEIIAEQLIEIPKTVLKIVTDYTSFRCDLKKLSGSER